MDISKLPLFALVTKRMAWLSQRQGILAENIANADTPGYRPRDLKPVDFRRMLSAQSNELSPQRTEVAHLTPTKPAEEYRSMEQPEPYETSLSGNAVVVEEQMMKVAETAMAYQTTANLYQKHLDMIKAVLGRGGS